MSYFASNHFESNHFASNYLAGVTVEEVGGGGGSSTKGKGWARERAQLEASLRPPKVQEVKKAPVIEQSNGLELLAEANDIHQRLLEAEIMLKRGEIAKAELDEFIKAETEALDVILMALELDKYVIREIIM